MGVYTHVRVCDHVILKNSYTQNQLSRCVVLLFKLLCLSVYMTIEIVGFGGYKSGFYLVYIYIPARFVLLKIGIDTVPDVCFAGFCWV